MADPEQISPRGIERAPLMVVEVLSPSTRALDRHVKLRRYAVLGVPHYWVADPDAGRIECFRMGGDDYRLVAGASVPDPLTHPDWPELTIDLAALWR